MGLSFEGGQSLDDVGAKEVVVAMGQRCSQIVHRRAFPPMAQTGVPRAERRRGGKVSPRMAPQIHNPSPFVQTHGRSTRRGHGRQTIAHEPANFVG